MRKNQFKEISKIDLILAVLSVEFLSCGIYNEYFYKGVVSRAFTQRLEIWLMIAMLLLTLFLLMRSNICRNKNTALGVGLFPVMVVMYAAYYSDFKFQIASTWLICALSIIRAAIAISHDERFVGINKVIIMIRYSIMLISTMGIVAFMFISI